MGDMMEDITKMWEKFNLLEVESVGIKTQEVDFEPLVFRGNACVVGNLLADRTVGKEIIKTRAGNLTRDTRTRHEHDT
jgi:hypothetical protein